LIREGEGRTHSSTKLSRRQRSRGTFSGAGTNLKVGGTGPLQKWENRSDAKRWKFFLVVPLHFLALKAQLVVWVSAFMVVSIQFGQFLVCCSSTHGVSPCPAICNSGGARAPVLYGVGATGRFTPGVVLQNLTSYRGNTAVVLLVCDIVTE